MKFPVILFIFFFSGIGFGQVVTIPDSISSNIWQTEAGGYTNTKKIKIYPCKTHLEENKTSGVMDTSTSVIHISFYCLCSDYLMDINVKLSDGEKTYTSITDKSGCDFMHINPGNYKLEVFYKYARKFKPIRVEVKSGHIYEWKIFMCEN